MGTHWINSRDTTKLTKESLTNSTPHQSLMAMQALNKHMTNLTENYTKCLTGLCPQKGYIMWTGQKNHGTTGISVNRGELLKTGIESIKNTEKITTGAPTPLKETRTIDYWNSTHTKKNQIITKQIMDNSKNTKELFRIVNNLTGWNIHNPLPPGKTSEEIAEDFAKFFSNKITIWESFTGTPQYHPKETNTPKLTTFRPLTDGEVKREIMGMKNKNCELDHISTLMLKGVITACLPTITCIVNMSLRRGHFITDWKQAIVRPLLKKTGSKPLHKKYRPVSNLSFLSKLVEWCMLQQLLDHCTQHNLISDFQSA